MHAPVVLPAASPGSIAAMVYKHITDLDDELRSRSSEFASLAAAWRARQAELKGYDKLQTLHERMRRRWAIDTGMIEGLYTLTRGTTELLIDRGFHIDLPL